VILSFDMLMWLSVVIEISSSFLFFSPLENMEMRQPTTKKNRSNCATSLQPANKKDQCLCQKKEEESVEVFVL
jgi:hypothetical protein